MNNILKRIFTIVIATMILTQCVACSHQAGKLPPVIANLTKAEKKNYATLAAQNTERAKVIAQGVEDTYIIGRRGDTLFVGMYVNTSTGRPRDTVSVWHLTSMLSMTSKLWSIHTGEQANHYKSLYGEILSTMDYYKGTGLITDYNSTKEQTMYAVNRATIKGTASLEGVSAVYDDQMWIIRELLYVYQMTNDENYLTQAKQLTQTCLDAWDNSVVEGEEVGGITWGPGYFSKHTCSNGPLIVALVDLYEITQTEDYLTWAKKIYNWTKEQFQLKSGVYGDNAKSWRGEEGEGEEKHYFSTTDMVDPDMTAYTYNVGTMISGGAALYKVTGEETYLEDAKHSAKGTYDVFAKATQVDGKTLYQYAPARDNLYNGPVWFNLILLEGYLELFPYDENCKTYIDAFQTSLDYAYENYQKENGFLPRDLLLGWNMNQGKDQEKDIMDQAAYAEIYAQLAEFYAYLAEQ